MALDINKGLGWARGGGGSSSVFIIQTQSSCVTVHLKKTYLLTSAQTIPLAAVATVCRETDKDVCLLFEGPPVPAGNLCHAEVPPTFQSMLVTVFHVRVMKIKNRSCPEWEHLISDAAGESIVRQARAQII